MGNECRTCCNDTPAVPYGAGTHLFLGVPERCSVVEGTSTPPRSRAISRQVGRAIGGDEHNATLLCIQWSTHGTGRVRATDYLRHPWTSLALLDTYRTRTQQNLNSYHHCNLYFLRVPEVRHIWQTCCHLWRSSTLIDILLLYTSSITLLAESAAPLIRSAVSNKTHISLSHHP